MPMKTAVLISGQPRDVAETWRSAYDNLICALPNPDVLIYTSEPFPDDGLFDTLKPKKYKVEDQFRHHDIEEVLRKAPYYDEGHLNSYVQQIYGLKKVWELKEEYEKESGTIYDLVVRTRPDFIWLRPISLDWLELDKISNLHSNELPYITTEFALGPDALMKHFFSVYDWILSGGSEWLNPNNPRLPIVREWNSDTIMAAYLYDHLKLTLGKNTALPRQYPGAYYYYRILRNHKIGIYYLACPEIT